MRRFALGDCRTPRFVSLLSLTLIVGWMTSFSPASVVVQHQGDVEPDMEGWVAQGNANGVAAGPMQNDGGVASWFVADASSSPGSSFQYTHTGAAPHLATALSMGWILRGTVRLHDVGDSVLDAGSVMFSFSDGARAYRIGLGSEIDGDALVLLADGGATGFNATGQLVTLDGLGRGYHNYELRFRPASGSADLWVDGQRTVRGYTGYASNESSVNFGSSSNADTGRGNWALVEWEVAPVPEPASLLLALPIVVVAASRLRKRG